MYFRKCTKYAAMSWLKQDSQCNLGPMKYLTHAPRSIDHYKPFFQCLYMIIGPQINAILDVVKRHSNQRRPWRLRRRQFIVSVVRTDCRRFQSTRVHVLRGQHGRLGRALRWRVSFVSFKKWIFTVSGSITIGLVSSLAWWDSVQANNAIFSC